MQKLCKVKTEEQIKNTLDKDGFCSNVAMVSAMYRHCGEVYIARPAWRKGIWQLYDKKIAQSPRIRAGGGHGCLNGWTSTQRQTKTT